MSVLGRLVRARTRRDRWQLLIWAVGMALLAVSSTSGIARTYGQQADREVIVRLVVANPAIMLLRGLPQGADLDAFVFFQIFTYFALMAGLMSTFLAVRHTRADEETGRAEVVEATPAGRLLPVVATAIHGVVADVVLGAVVTACFVGAGLDAYGSLLTGAAVTACGLAFLAVGLLVAQLMATARAANAVAASLVGAAFLVRGVGDAAGTAAPDGLHVTSSWLSWLSPISWSQHTAAYTANRWWPLLLDLALAGVAGAAAAALLARRDSGGSLLAGRAGRTAAGRTLAGSFGLAWRQSRTAVIGWCVGAAACGVLAGAIGPLIGSVGSSAQSVGDALQQMVPGQQISLGQALLTAMFSLVGVLAALCATQVIVRLRQDEAGGTAEVLLATPLSRVRWLADYLLLGLTTVVAVLAVSALASSLTGWLVADKAQAGDSVRAAAAQLPAALVYLGVLALVAVVLPRLTVALGWLSVGIGVFLGVFGGLVGLPRGVVDLAPFAHTPVVLGPDPDWTGGGWMLAVAALGAVAALLAMRRRELST